MCFPYHRTIFFTAICLLPVPVMAGTANAATEWNPVLVALVCLIAALAMAIALLANVLKGLAYAYSDKLRKDKANLPKAPLLLLLFAIPAIPAFAQDEAVQAAAQVSPYISGIPRGDFYTMTGIICFELLLMLVLLWQISGLVKALRGIPEKAHVPGLVFKKNFLDVFNKSVAVKDEAAIVLDHDYDGIHELDNDLPPWWKWGFVLTIVVAVLYLGYYHAAGGPSQAEEYAAAVVKADREKAEYLAKAANNVDEHSVVMVTDATELSAAATIFGNTCSACHAKDGGGGVGPNLTDAYWLHGGSISDVFKSVKYGWPDKGMKSWKDDYSPKQLAALASYVKSLAGTRPVVAKAPQGELFADNTKKPDSTIAAPAAK